MKIVKFLSVIFLSVFVFSCASTNKSAQGGNKNLIVRGEEQNPTKLQKNQFLSVSNKVDNPQYLQATNWSKVRITSDFLDELKGHSDFNNDEKYQLLSFIFDELPLNGKDGVVREVYIGKYYSDGSPLVIRVAVMTPVVNAPIKNEKVIVLTSNAIKMSDGSVGKGQGAFISLDYNAALFCVLNKGLLTNGQRLENKNKKIDISALSSLERVGVAQNYLADENVENDLIANDLVTMNMNDKDELPAIVIMSMLMKYNYLLSQEDLASAKELWKEILEYSKNVPGDMNPESLEAINGEALYLMERLVSQK